MSEPNFVTCNCNVCSGRIEFEVAHAGVTVQCPHCKMDTVLFLGEMPEKPANAALPSIQSPNAIGGESRREINRDNGGSRVSKLVRFWFVAATLCLVAFGAGKFWGVHQSNKMSSDGQKFAVGGQSEKPETEAQRIAQLLKEAEADGLLEKSETETQRMARFRKEAEYKLLEECTNSLVGFQRVVSSYIRDSDVSPENWTATATADFVNHIGGIDRTNLPFKFEQFEGHIICMVDVVAILKAEHKRFMREMEQIQGGE